jgi:hypothetical protein
MEATGQAIHVALIMRPGTFTIVSVHAKASNSRF